MSEKNTSLNDPLIYTIRVKGVLDDQWSRWFSGFSLIVESQDPPITLLSGPIVDQAKLRNILNKLWDLNLTLLSVNTSDSKSIGM